MKIKKEQFVWAMLRIVLGWTFLWSFIDKVFGLGFATESGKAWIDGVSPTTGFLKFGTHGPFAAFFQGLAGVAIVDWLFMLGLLLIGLSLILGVGLKIAGYSGAALVLLMWLSLLPPEHNPIVDEHIVYLFALLGIASTESGNVFGLGNWWAKQKLVKKHPILK